MWFLFAGALTFGVQALFGVFLFVPILASGLIILPTGFLLLGRRSRRHRGG